MTLSNGSFTAGPTCWIATNHKAFLSPSSQPTATIKLKLAVKDREGRANPPAPTRLAPPVRAPTGEMMPLHPTSPPSGAPWSRPPLPALPRPPPRDPAARGTPRAPPSWIPARDGRCFQSRRETARSLGTSTTSGESRLSQDMWIPAAL